LSTAHDDLSKEHAGFVSGTSEAPKTGS
jgi:hypothetical protein